MPQHPIQDSSMTKPLLPPEWAGMKLPTPTPTEKDEIHTFSDGSQGVIPKGSDPFLVHTTIQHIEDQLQPKKDHNNFLNPIGSYLGDPKNRSMLGGGLGGVMGGIAAASLPQVSVPVAALATLFPALGTAFGGIMGQASADLQETGSLDLSNEISAGAHQGELQTLLGDMPVELANRSLPIFKWAGRKMNENILGPFLSDKDLANVNIAPKPGESFPSGNNRRASVRALSDRELEGGYGTIGREQILPAEKQQAKLTGIEARPRTAADRLAESLSMIKKQHTENTLDFEKQNPLSNIDWQDPLSGLTRNQPRILADAANHGPESSQHVIEGAQDFFNKPQVQTPYITPSQGQAFKEALGDDIHKWGEEITPSRPDFYQKSQKDIYHSLQDDLHALIPANKPLDQHMSEMIPLHKALAKASRPIPLGSQEAGMASSNPRPGMVRTAIRRLEAPAAQKAYQIGVSAHLPQSSAQITPNLARLIAILIGG